MKATKPIRNFALLASTATALILAACTEEPSGAEQADLNEADTLSEAEALTESLPAMDFVGLPLGGEIERGPGKRVSTALMKGNAKFAEMTSWVACPAEMIPCDPETAPADTVYTYVYVVTPGGDNDDDTAPTSAPDSYVERAQFFRMTSPSPGFTGEAGYAKAEAIAAMGDGADVVMSCDGQGLGWTLNSGDGGNQWSDGEPITFFWRSTLPPAGSEGHFEITANYTDARGNGLAPLADQAVPNACATTGTP